MGNTQEMIREIKEHYFFDSPQVFSAMLRVPREEFVPPEFRPQAYVDGPVSIGYGQTISQPYTVAFMTHLLISDKGQAISDKKLGKVLEIGTGSGYQAAILSLLAKRVYSVEIIPELADSARKRLKKLGYQNVEVKAAGGKIGWREKAPFEAILVTAGMETVSKELFAQLKEKGILVAPVGKGMDKEMTKFVRRRGKISKETYGIFHFVPFVEGN